MVCVTQITKNRPINLLQSPHSAQMGFLYWETCACLINFEKEKVNEKVLRPDFHAYFEHS
jgi:hypothetical protein